MADFDKINIDAVSYNVKDTTARQQITEETGAREQADTQLSQQIGNVSTSVQEETNAREQADTQLSQQISAVNSQLYKTIVDYGAVAGGVQDCTDAIMAQINAEGVARIPIGLFLVSKQITMRNCSIVGTYADLSYTYNPSNNNSSALIITTTAIIDCFTAENIVFIPNTNKITEKKPFAAPSGQRACSSLFTKCRFENWEYCASNIGSFSCTQCTFANCKYGLYNIEDSRITSCLFAANTWPISLNDYWGADTIADCKIEWNGNETDGGGIACYNTYQLSIVGNIIDRCGPTGLNIYSCRNVTCTGNVILRSYVQNELYGNCNYLTACNVNLKRDWNSDTEMNTTVPPVGVRNNGSNYSYIISSTDCNTPYSEDNKGTSTTVIVNGKAVSQP